MNDAGRGEVADVLEGTKRWQLVAGEGCSFIRGLPDDSIDAFMTDPPYSSGGMIRSDRTNASTISKYRQTGVKIPRLDFSGDNRDQRGFFAWCAWWMGEAFRAARPQGYLLVFSDWRQLPTMTDAVQAGGWVWRGIVPWNKGPGVRPDLGRFANQCEFVTWATKGPAAQEEAGHGRIGGFFTYAIKHSDKHHLTGKPTALMRDMMRILKRPDSIVVDPFAGSATTGVAALREGHRFLGVELDPANYEQAEARLRRWKVDDEQYRELTKRVRRGRVKVPKKTACDAPPSAASSDG